MAELSVIIPVYNAADTLAIQLAALARESWTGSWEVILADNGSTDGSRSIAEAYANRLPNFRIVDASQCPGAGHARNVGARAAQGQAFAFCDADDEIGAGWLRAMGTALKHHEIVTSRYDTTKLNPKWVRKAYGSHAQEHGLQTLSYPPGLSHAGGASLGVQRAVHEAVGGFDESWRSLQDTEYCLRIQHLGFKLYLVPEAIVHCRYPKSLPHIFKQAYRYAKGNVRLYQANRLNGTRDAWRWRQHLYLWGDVLREALRIRDKGQLGRVVRLSGAQMGRLIGSLQYRVPPVCL